MEIKSSLLNYKEFANLKNNIVKISSIDGKDKFRVKLVEYINDTSDNNDDMFFYEMLPFSRFLNPSDESIAYTTPDHLIYLNSPGVVGEKYRVWDFIFCHECLHQLWDTFEVGEKIKKAGLEYNHNLLNIASDCVINDYLKTLRKKEPFENGIFPETLKDNYGVEYDRKKDTQYTLYLKLLKVYDEFKDELNKLAKEVEEKIGQGNSSSSSGSSSGSSSSSSGSSSSSSGSSSSSDSSGNSNNDGDTQSKELNSDSAQKAADKAKKSMEEAQQKADSNSNDKTLQENANKAKEAAERAKEAADKAKECADKGDKEGEKKAAEEAEKAAEEAEKAAKGSKNGNQSNGGNKSAGSGAGDDDIEDISQEDIDEIRKNAEEIIKKYKNKLTGPLGDFLGKCVASSALKKDGLITNTLRGQSGWNTQMNKICKAYVKKKIFQKKRQYEKTYSRIKRGSGFVKFGTPIDPGRKIKEDKMNIDIAFYIDRSGSMSDSIDNVFKAVFYIADALKKYFGKEKVVDKTIFESYAFDDVLHKIKFGQKMRASGGTMSFNNLLDCVNQHSKDFLINVIITDAMFSDIDTSTVKDLLKGINGILLFITNTDNEIMKDLSKKNSEKLNYILANSKFLLD